MTIDEYFSLVEKTKRTKDRAQLRHELKKAQFGSKYGSVKTTNDEGIEFDSKMEARYYETLKLLQQQGKIHDLELQVPFELAPAQVVRSHTKARKLVTVHKAMHYVADFVYYDDNNKRHVVDVKGFRTQEYKKKARLMKAILGIKIEEISNV